MSQQKYTIRVLLALIMLVLAACQTAKEEPTPTPTPAPAVGAVTVATVPATVECQPDPPAGWSRVTVLPGDTLSGLAEQHGTTVAEIRRVNCLTSNLPVAGDRLYLPPPVCTVSPPGGWKPYIVGSGDTVTALAAARNTTVDDVVEVNCLPRADALDIGQVLYLPALPTPTPTVTPLPTFTPPPPPPPPTVRPTPTLPLLTPTPGIVSVSNLPGVSGGNLLSQANLPGQTNPQPPVGGGEGVAGGGAGRAAPGGPIPKTTFILPPWGYSSVGWSPFCQAKSPVADTLVSTKTVVDVSLKADRGDLCMNHFPFGEVVSVTVSSVNGNTGLFGAFIVDAAPQTNAFLQPASTPTPSGKPVATAESNGPRRPPPVGRRPGGSAAVTPTAPPPTSYHLVRWIVPNLETKLQLATKTTLANSPGQEITKIEAHFYWPPDLPSGVWQVSAQADSGLVATSTFTSAVRNSPAIGLAGIRIGADSSQLVLRPGYRPVPGPLCSYLTPEEIKTGVVNIVGRNFLQTPLVVDVYQRSADDREKVERIGEIRSQTVQTAEGFSAEIDIHRLPADQDYFVVPRWEGDDSTQVDPVTPQVYTCFTVPPNPSP